MSAIDTAVYLQTHPEKPALDLHLDQPTRGRTSQSGLTHDRQRPTQLNRTRRSHSGTPLGQGFRKLLPERYLKELLHGEVAHINMLLWLKTPTP